jgi:hypothetical protein
VVPQQSPNAIWKATYAGLVDKAKLDALHPRDRIARWANIIADIDQQSARGVVTRCAVEVSSGREEPPRDSDAPAATELWSLNVLPNITAASSAPTSAVIGQRDAYLWVATGNTRAIAFYRKHRFGPDNATRYDPDWDCHESRMVRQH